MSVELDFSILDKITPESSPEDEQKPGKIYYKLEAEEKQRTELAEAAAKQLEVFAAHKNAISKAGQLTSDITKGVQTGEKPEILLLKAIKCISLMTGDNLFYEQNKSDLKNTYGIDISEELPNMENITPEELDEFLK